MNLLRRLGRASLFDGVTTAEERRDRVRAFTREKQLQLAIAGRAPDGKPETWSDLFSRMYGEAL